MNRPTEEFGHAPRLGQPVSAFSVAAAVRIGLRQRRRPASQKFVVFFQEWSAALDTPAQKAITGAPNG